MKNLFSFTLIVSVLMSVFAFQNNTKAQCSNDHAVLKNWYLNNNGEMWGVNWGQTINDATMQNWEGITLNVGGCVEKIVLNSKAVSGTLPNLNLPALRELSLSYGNLSGELPNLQACTALNRLSITGQKVTGVIPNFILPKLTELVLENNALNGTIPNLNLPALTTLYLSGNKLTGAIPNFNLPNLTQFSAGNNLLDGALPNFVNCPNLLNILLRTNKITALPNDLTLSKLNTLDIGNNLLTGAISSINCPKLSRLDLSKNKLTGAVPDFNKLSVLNTLKLSDNMLTDAIPNFNLPLLRDLDLSNNVLTGTIPNFNLPELGSLYLTKNKLSGGLPNFNLANLQYLAVSENQLSGAVPPLNLPKLLFLNLSDNQFSGNFPVMKLPNLFSFNAEKNLITGGLNNLDLPKTADLILTNNAIEGTVSGLNIPNLSNLYLSNNKITGIAVDNNLPKLLRIYLAQNSLTGLFPQLNLPALVFFDASQNKIDSCVQNYPTYPKLNKINVSENKLTFDDILRKDMGVYIFYAPQDSCGKVISRVALSGSAVTIPAGIDNGITTNTYTWSKVGDPTFSQKTRNLVFSSFKSSDAGDYYCEIKNAAASALILTRRLVRLSWSPLFKVTKTDNNCSNENKGAINVTTIAGALPYTVSWSKNGFAISDKTLSVSNLDNGNYKLTVTDANAIMDTMSVVISSKNQAPAPIITEKNGVLSTNTTGIHQWFLGNLALPNATLPTYMPLQNGTFKVVVSANGCTGTSSDYIFKSIATRDLNVIPINIYPNPVQQNLYIQSADNLLIESISIKNSLGQVVLAKALYTSSIDVSYLSEGLYYLECFDVSKRLIGVQKFMK